MIDLVLSSHGFSFRSIVVSCFPFHFLVFFRVVSVFSLFVLTMRPGSVAMRKGGHVKVETFRSVMLTVCMHAMAHEPCSMHLLGHFLIWMTDRKL